MRHLKPFSLFFALLLVCTGCASSKPVQHQCFAMDTFMTFTLYGRQAQTAAAQAEDYIIQLEDSISVTRPDSDLAQLAQAGGEWTEVSEETFRLLSTAKELCRQTEGILDITAYPAVKAWGFTTGEYRVPGDDELAELTERIDWSAIELDPEQNAVRLPVGMSLDLGAVAKGWAGDVLAQLLAENGIESAVLSLGGNIQAVGKKPDGSLWRVGIQDPFSQQGAYLGTLEVEDKAVVTSGGYERYFEQDGKHYCHIIDPDSAAPAQSGLASVTIIGESGTVCDALSTALFIMGSEDAARFWRTSPHEFEYILILEDGSIHITQGLEHSFTLMQDSQEQKVTVIAP